MASMDARRRDKSRPSPPPPRKNKKIFYLYWGPSCHFFFIWGPFCNVFLIFWAFLLLFTSWWGPFFGLAPPPHKNFCGAHDCKEGSRACFPEFFLCDRNLLSSGHVLLRFCLKNDKNSEL